MIENISKEKGIINKIRIRFPLSRLRNEIIRELLSCFSNALKNIMMEIKESNNRLDTIPICKVNSGRSLFWFKLFK